MTCEHLMRGAPDCVFCHRDQLAQEVSTLRSDLTACQLERDRLRNQLVDCEQLLAAHDPQKECGYWIRTMPPEPQSAEHK